MKDIRQYTQANRRAWNEAALVMARQNRERLERDFAQPGFSLIDETFGAKLREIGLAGKSVAHLCCHNGIELLSIVNLGAKDGVGFDISDEAIAVAQSLAAVAGSSARFVQTDVYDIGAEYDAQFDLAIFTIGGLCWLPDLPAALAIAARLLRPGGQLAIYDMHPFTMMLPLPAEPAYRDPWRVEYSYFQTEPLIDTVGIDYVGHTQYESSVKYDFPYKLSDLLNATLAAGFSLLSFAEYPHDISESFGHLVPDGKAPLCYLLHGRKAG